MAAAGGPEVWARHSYALGTLEPSLSDLDLTFYFKKKPSVRALERVYGVYEKLKRAYPLFGEVNTFVEEEVEKLWHFANPLETARDPILVSRTQSPTREPTAADKSVFLLRMLESNVANLMEFGNHRRGKWQKYADVAGFELPQIISLESLTESVVNSFPGYADWEREKAARALEIYWQSCLAGTRYYELSTLVEFQCLFPHRVDFKMSPYPFSFSNSASVDIAEAQIGWEIWGMYSQLRNLAFGHKTGWNYFVEHFEFLKKFTGHALKSWRTPEQISVFIDAMDWLISEYELHRRSNS